MQEQNPEQVFSGASEELLDRVSGAIARIGSCRSLQEFVALAPELLGNPMIIYDLHNHVLACTDCEIEDVVYESLHRRGVLPDSVTESSRWQRHIEAIWRAREVQETCFSGTSCFTRTLWSGSRMMGRIVVPQLLRAGLPGDKLMLELFATQLIPFMASRQIGETRPTTELGMSLYRLIEGAHMNAKERAVVEGQFRGNLILLCFNTVDLDDQRINVIRRLEGEMISYAGNTIVLISEYGNDFGPLWQAKVKQLLQPLWIHCGMSSAFRDISGIRRAYNEARMALTIGVRIDVEAILYIYDDLRLYDMFRSVAEQNDTLMRFLSPGMHDLIRVDEEQHLELLKTLHCYLVTNRSLQKTATRLHIHRNTVTHRINRAMEILGIGQEDGRALMRTATELQMLEYMDSHRYFEE